MYIDLIRSRLASVALHTELLEACDWDQSEADAVLIFVADYFNNLNYKRLKKWDDIVALAKNYFCSTLGKTISDIIINIVELEKSEMIKLMELPEQ